MSAMKKIILTSVLISLFALQTTNSQMGRFQKYSLSESQVPESVLASQRVNFPNSFVTNWFQYSNFPSPTENSSYYISSFQKQGSNSFRAYFTADGELISKITFLPTFTLPEVILERVHNSYLNTRIKSGDLIKLYDLDIEIYRVRLNTEGLLQYVYYDRYARMLSGSQIPAEVLTLN
jgi:hypothetical protein